MLFYISSMSVFVHKVYIFIIFFIISHVSICSVKRSDEKMIEFRKIQMTRSGTFFMTLPKDWAIRNNIQRGSVVASLITPDDKIIIDPKYAAEPTPKAVVIKPSLYLSREIISNYLLGYDIITIEAKDRVTLEQREIVKQTLSHLIGLEIIEENQSRIVMQCLLEPSALSPEKILRREHLITLGMCKDSIRALLDRDVHLAKDVITRDNEVDRLYFLLVRVLRIIVQNPSISEKLNVYPIECLDYRLAASLIELVADQSLRIAEYAIKLKDLELSGDISRALSDLWKVVYDAYNDSVTAFLTRNISLAESIKEKRQYIENLSQRVEFLVRSLPFEKAEDLITVISLLNRVYDHSIDISDLTTARTF